MTQTHAHTTAAAPWQCISLNDQAALNQLNTDFGIDARQGSSPTTDHPTLQVNFSGPAPQLTRHLLTLVFHGEQLITLHSDDSAAYFTPAVSAESQRTESPHTPARLALTLLRRVNDMNERTVEHLMRQLDLLNTEIHNAIAGHDEQGSPLGVSDMRELMTRMNDSQEVLAHTQESQFQLLRATSALRQLGTPPHPPTHEHEAHLDRLDHSANAVNRYASVALERMSAMQRSITAMLEVKQHEIVKVFTIITAVFLPPTLIATFYGMNFENMPALATQHGFLITTVLTFIAAVIPLWYIKQKGWLR